MGRRFYYLFIVFYLTAALIFAVYLRGQARRSFYEICSMRVKQRRILRELWQKQLRVESLISPAAISEELGE